MDLPDLQRNWQRMGAEDPLWAVSTAPEYRGGLWEPTAFFETGRRQVNEILEHALRLGVELGSAKALDFGCGVGRLSQALAQHFEVVVAVDIAPSMLKKAEEFDKEGRIQFLLNERPDLSLLESNSFDLIYSEITLMHMEPRYSLAYVVEFLRVAKPGGLIVFQVPEPTRRQKVRERLPRRLVKAGNHLRTLRQPMMEIYGILRNEVEGVLQASGGVVLDVQEWRVGKRCDRRYWVQVPA